MLQGGTAFATVIAAPLGAFLGGLIGWRGAFFIVVPVGIAAIVWQLLVLPKLPPERAQSLGKMLGLFRRPIVAVGMAATTLAFTGQFALSTYLRPFLEGVTGLDINALSLVLLGLGLAGLVGTSVVGFVLREHLGKVLIGLPAALVAIALLLIFLGPYAIPTALLLALWGFFTTPIPVAWGTWMTRVIPNDLEAGGGLQVALIQFAITFGALTGGLLFDASGWWCAFALAAALLAGATLLSVLAAQKAGALA